MGKGSGNKKYIRIIYKEIERPVYLQEGKKLWKNIV